MSHDRRAGLPRAWVIALAASALLALPGCGKERPDAGLLWRLSNRAAVFAALAAAGVTAVAVGGRKGGASVGAIERRMHWVFAAAGLGCFLVAWHLAYRSDVVLRPSGEAPAERTDSERAAVLRALGKIQADPKAQVPLLVEALRDRSPAVRTAAIEALSQIGPPARDAAPALLEAYKASPGGAAPKQAAVVGEPHPAGWGSAEGFAVAGGLCLLASALSLRGRVAAPAREKSVADG